MAVVRVNNATGALGATLSSATGAGGTINLGAPWAGPTVSTPNVVKIVLNPTLAGVVSLNWEVIYATVINGSPTATIVTRNAEPGGSQPTQPLGTVWICGATGPDLDALAIDSAVVHLVGNESIAGVKTFASAPVFTGGAQIGSGDPNDLVVVDTLGVHGRRISIQPLDPTANAGSALQLIPGTGNNSATDTPVEILLFNKVGTNYERWVFTMNNNSYLIVSNANNAGLSRNIYVQFDGNVALGWINQTAVCFYSDASIDLNGSTYTANGGRTYGSLRTRIADPTNTGSSRLIIDTRTGTPASNTSDSSILELRRGGVPYLYLGLNGDAANVDNFVISNASTVAILQLTQAGVLTVAGGLTVSAGTVSFPSSAYATPAIALGTAAAVGSAATFIRSNATIAAFDTTAPTTIASADAAATGTAAFAARRDHKHGMLTLAAVATSGSASDLTAGTLPTARFPGGAFNGNSELVQLDGSGKLPAIDGSALTGITESQVASLTSDLALKAPLASPTLTGTVAIGTDNTSKIVVGGSVATYNLLTIQGAATGSQPGITATGVDANVHIWLTPKASGGVYIKGSGILGAAAIQDPGANINAIKISSAGLAFNGTNAIAKPTVTGAKGGNAALGSLMTALANYGLVTDSTTA